MEWIGFFSLFLVLCYAGYPGRVRKLERKIKKLNKREENAEMSRIITKLTGKKCQLAASEIFGTTKTKAEVVDVDEEWIQLKITDRKGNEQTKIVRIDSIEQIELLD